MVMKVYACPTFPTLQIGDRVFFSGGFFKTDSLVLQRIVERNEGFGWRIREIKQEAIEAVQDAIEVAEDAGTNFDIDLFDSDILEPDKEIALVIETVSESGEPPKEVPEQEITRTFLTRSRVMDLRLLAKDLMPDEDFSTLTKRMVQRKIEKKLGL